MGALAWDTVESGPPNAERTVLLLPGGMCSARSYAEVMAEPAVGGLRLVAATLPGMQVRRRRRISARRPMPASPPSWPSQ